MKQQIGFFQESNVNNEETKMPIITCKCGEQVLVVPDLALMTEAIKKHLAKCNVCSEQFLTNQIMEALSKTAVN